MYTITHARRTCVQIYATTGMCTNVCVCVYIHVYIHMYMHVHIYTLMHLYLYVHVYTQLYVYIFMHASYVRMYVRACEVVKRVAACGGDRCMYLPLYERNPRACVSMLLQFHGARTEI